MARIYEHGELLTETFMYEGKHYHMPSWFSVENEELAPEDRLRNLGIGTLVILLVFVLIIGVVVYNVLVK